MVSGNWRLGLGKLLTGPYENVGVLEDCTIWQLRFHIFSSTAHNYGVVDTIRSLFATERRFQFWLVPRKEKFCLVHSLGTFAWFSSLFTFQIQGHR